MDTLWLHQSDENKIPCSPCFLVKWMKRATGIGYRKFPPLPTDPIVDPRAADPLKSKTDQVVREIERLESELRRLGIRSPILWPR